MTCSGFGTTSRMITNNCWYNGSGFHTGLGVSYVTGLYTRKGSSYCAPPFITLLVTNQGIGTFNNGYVITMSHWNMHFEVMILDTIWMATNPSLMMTNRAQQRVILMRRNTKYYHIPNIYLTS